MDITEDFIIQFANNPATVKNGKDLATKNKFKELYLSHDNSLIFGSCAGSGKNPYNCSVDFTDNSNPIARCSCPSRQIPCKHTIGLLFCKLQNENFNINEIPEDISSKRGKIEKKIIKNKEDIKKVKTETTTMTKTKATNAIKKLKIQEEGILLAEKLLSNIIRLGIHSIDSKNRDLYKTQIKELGNYYIGGIQSSFNDFLEASFASKTSENFISAIEKANYLFALIKKAKQHTENKIKDLQAFPNMTELAEEATIHSQIEEQMGYAWKLTELMAKNLCINDAKLIQLNFNIYINEKKEYVDQGIWLEFSTGRIFLTKNYRPIKAVEYIAKQDSCFSCMNIENLFIYPGEENPRVRWENFSLSSLTQEDFNKAKTFAKTDFSEVLKKVKSQIKNPLSDKEPIFLLKVDSLKKDSNGTLVFADKHNNLISLLNNGVNIFEHLEKNQIENQAVLCKFKHDFEKDNISIIPISIINSEPYVNILTCDY